MALFMFSAYLVGHQEENLEADQARITADYAQVVEQNIGRNNRPFAQIMASKVSTTRTYWIAN